MPAVLWDMIGTDVEIFLKFFESFLFFIFGHWSINGHHLLHVLFPILFISSKTICYPLPAWEWRSHSGASLEACPSGSGSWVNPFPQAELIQILISTSTPRRSSGILDCTNLTFGCPFPGDLTALAHDSLSLSISCREDEAEMNEQKWRDWVWTRDGGRHEHFQTTALC